jgi:hypothetical protein
MPVPEDLALKATILRSLFLRSRRSGAYLGHVVSYGAIGAACKLVQGNCKRVERINHP